MIISGDKALEAFKKAKLVREEYLRYTVGPDKNVARIEDLYRVVSQMYGLTIRKTQVPFEGTFVRGLMERWPNEIRVMVRMGQSDDWMRFTAVKELCHVIIDESEDWSVDGVKTIEDLLIEYFLGEGDVAKSASQSEVLAEMVAAELLYPFDCRQPDLDKKTSLVKIATHHKMPSAMVARVLDEHYHTRIAMPIWQEIGV